MSEFDACYLSVGAGAPNFMGIPGTSLNGVYSSSEFLTRINLMHSYEFPEYDTPIKRAKNICCDWRRECCNGCRSFSQTIRR